MRCTINLNFNSESVFYDQTAPVMEPLLELSRNEMGMNLAFREATGDSTKLAPKKIKI